MNASPITETRHCAANKKHSAHYTTDPTLACGEEFVALSGGVRGCPVHGIRSSIEEMRPLCRIPVGIFVNTQLPPKFYADSVGKTWNGWATPAFQLDEMRRVAAQFGFREVTQPLGKPPVFILEQVDDVDIIVADQKDGLYRPDGWCWDRLDQTANTAEPDLPEQVCPTCKQPVPET